jgi:hypothetical protein
MGLYSARLPGPALVPVVIAALLCTLRASPERPTGDKTHEWRLFLPAHESVVLPNLFSAEYQSVWPEFVKSKRNKPRRRLDEYLRLSSDFVGLKKRAGKKLELKVCDNRTHDGIESW